MFVNKNVLCHQQPQQRAEDGVSRGRFVPAKSYYVATNNTELAFDNHCQVYWVVCSVQWSSLDGIVVSSTLGAL